MFQSCSRRPFGHAVPDTCYKSTFGPLTPLSNLHDVCGKTAHKVFFFFLARSRILILNCNKLVNRLKFAKLSGDIMLLIFRYYILTSIIHILTALNLQVVRDDFVILCNEKYLCCPVF